MERVCSWDQILSFKSIPLFRNGMVCRKANRKSQKKNKKKKKKKKNVAFVKIALQDLSRVKFSTDDILKYFFYFSKETDFDISCKLSLMETTCMKCQIRFSEK